VQLNLAALKLRTKAGLIVGLILVLVLGLNSVFTVRMLVRELRQGLQAKAGVFGGLLVKEVRKALDFGLGIKDLEDASRRCQALVAENPELAHALIVDAGGTILFHSDAAAVGRPAGAVLPGIVARGGASAWIGAGTTAGTCGSVRFHRMSVPRRCK